MTAPSEAAEMTLGEALALSRDPAWVDPESDGSKAGGSSWLGHVQPGWDIFGIPHGGYLLAMAAQAALCGSETPDIFSVTGHFLQKAEHGPIAWTAREAAASRRMRSMRMEGIQNDKVILVATALVGDRTEISGATENLRVAPVMVPSAADAAPFAGPQIARNLGVVVSADSLGFATGRMDPSRAMVASMTPPEGTAIDQLLAIVACDITPPAIWNALGMSGWVPTVELTVQVRRRPSAGSLLIRAETRTVSDGFLEEDAEVFDASGQVVALSRQLARWRSA